MKDKNVAQSLTLYREGASSGDLPGAPSPSEEPTSAPQKSREPIFNQIPVGVAVLIAIIIAAHLVFSLQGPAGQAETLATFALSPAQFARDLAAGDWISAMTMLFGYQFLHGGTLHIVMNLAMLLQAGPIAEAGLRRNQYSTVRFVIFFLFCGVGGGLAFCAINPGSEGVTIGASGAISGIFAGFLWGALGLARPGQAMLKPVLASAVVFLLINVGLAALARGFNFVPIAWESHLGGFVAGLILYPIFARLGRSQAAG
ncbi:MAG: rhomboid family intramembrane serine protease [Hyphomonadaceae bacterium]